MGRVCLRCGRSVPPSRTSSLYCSDDCRRAAEQPAILAGPALATGVVGAASELMVCCALLSDGLPTFRAVSQACPSDLVVLYQGVLMRVEVKTGVVSRRTGLPRWSGHHVPARYDLLAIVADGQIVYQPDLATAAKAVRKSYQEASDE